MRGKYWLVGVGIVASVGLLYGQLRGPSRDGITTPPLLTSELLKKLFSTQQELAKLEKERPPAGQPRGGDPETVAAQLDKNPDVQQVLRKIGWTAAEYVNTHSTIVKTLIAMDELDTGDAKELPDDVLEGNAQFLRKPPEDVAAEYTRWRQITIDPALRQMREMRRKIREELGRKE